MEGLPESRVAEGWELKTKDDPVFGAGFGEFQVPDGAGSYVHNYSRRGMDPSRHGSEAEPVRTEMRWANAQYVGGPLGYVAGLSSDQFLEDLPTKRGNAGTTQQIRWAPGADLRGNFGTASHSVLRNYAHVTRRGPRREDYIEQPLDTWFDQHFRGYEATGLGVHSGSYHGVQEAPRRKQPFLETRQPDTSLLRPLFESNAMHIPTVFDKSAKQLY